MVWYSERMKKVLAVDPDALVEDGKAKKAEDEFGTSEYVFAFGALEFWFRDAQKTIQDLHEDLEKAQAELSALQYAAEDVLDDEEVSTPYERTGQLKVWEWLYQAAAAYRKAIAAGATDQQLIEKRLEEEEIESEQFYQTVEG